MAKSRAQIQKEYRERKKQKEGQAYLNKESSRVLKYYVSASELTLKERKERNAVAKKRNKLYRQRQKTKQRNQEETSGYESQDTRLIVKLPSSKSGGKGNGGKKKYTRALARAHKTLKSVQQEKLAYFRKYRAKQKQCERLQFKLRNVTTNQSTNNTMLNTPNAKTNQEVAELQLTPKRAKKVRRKLLLKNVVLGEIAEARSSTSSKKDKKTIANITSGRISKKYRCLSVLSKSTGLCRRLLSKSEKKNVRPDRRVSAVKRLSSSVECFMSREDNSRTQPGKADAVKTSDGSKKQTKVLTDYLSNLHEKFRAENQDVKMSLATFCRLRPKHILPARFICRTSCLCIKHQNMALKCQSLRAQGIMVKENPESLIDSEIDITKEMEDHSPENVSYKIWKQVDCDGKKRMKVVENFVSKIAFMKMVTDELHEFRNHVFRVKSQYREIKKLKENLPENELLVQMDFAENYTCKSLAEVQSAYWNQTPVTIHPVVSYFRDASGPLRHKSVAIVSDELSHSTSTVCAFLDALIPVLKEIKPNATRVHYWTDSPSSQYRNKTIFALVAEHTRTFGLDARWNYFEAGHGKGPCDGLGGTIKRMADEAVKRGAVIIQEPKEFFQWADNSSMKEVKFLFVGKESCNAKLQQLATKSAKPVKGTMKLHAVGYDSLTSSLKIKTTSCYCEPCLAGGFCDKWETRQIPTITPVETVEANDPAVIAPVETEVVTAPVETEVVTAPVETEVVIAPVETEMVVAPVETEVVIAPVETEMVIDPVETNQTIAPAENATPIVTEVDEHIDDGIDQGLFDVNVDDYVACVYDKAWYIGRVLERDDDEVQITFMQKAKSMFRWPATPDIIWCEVNDILCTISTLEASGKSRRLFKITEDEHTLIEAKFENYL